MSYKKYLKRISAIALILGLSITGTKTLKVSAVGSNDTVDVQLLTFNDFHGELEPDTRNKRGGAAYFASYIDKLRAENPNTLVMSGGDSIGGTPAISALKQDEPTLEVFKAMGVDVLTTGNHEYDEGITELQRVMNGGKHEATGDWAGSNLDWVTANVVYKDGDKKGQPVFNPYTIKNVGGIDIGVIGVVTQEAPGIVVPNGIKDVEFTDEAEAINKYTKELSDKGIKTIVVLAHSGAATDKATGNLIDEEGQHDVYDIAQKIDGEVDVIVAGHSHQLANTTIKREGKDDILVTQAYSKGSTLTDSDIVIDKTTKDVVSMKSQNITTSHEGITPNAKVESMVKKYKDDVAPLLARKVGYAEEDMKKDIQGIHGESEVGRMIAEAQLWATKEHDIQISMMNIGGVRADLAKGELTYDSVYKVQPFSNDLTKMQLTGEQVKRILEQQSVNDWMVAMEQGKSARPTMLQIDGFSYDWYANKNSAGKWELKVDKIYLNKADGKVELKPEDKVNAVVNVFLAQGQDGFTAFKESQYQVIKGDLEAFEEYVTHFSALDNDKDGNVGLNKPDVINNPNIINLMRFKDIKDHWAEKEIKDFAAKGYIHGSGDGNFNPNTLTSRGSFVKMLNRVFGLTQKSGIEFSDTKGHWAKDEVDIAVTAGIAQGTSKETFEPDKIITRQEAAKMLANYKKISDANHDKIKAFSDYNQVDGWAVNELEAVVEKGYIKGTGEGKLAPKVSMTKAEAVVMLSRIK